MSFEISLISLLALVISLVSLFLNFKNRREQNLKWERLNEAEPDIKEIRFTRFKELSGDEALSLDWGYEPLCYAKGEVTGEFYLPYYLSVQDAHTNLILKTNPVSTIGELEKELNRIGHIGNCIPLIHFKLKIIIENIGNVKLEELTIEVEMKLPDSEWIKVYNSNLEVSLSKQRTATIPIDFDLPLNSIPAQIESKVYFEWKNGMSKSFGAKWTKQDDFWSYKDIN
jgi:hypothetical protein